MKALFPVTTTVTNKKRKKKIWLKRYYKETTIKSVAYFTFVVVVDNAD